MSVNLRYRAKILFFIFGTLLVVGSIGVEVYKIMKNNKIPTIEVQRNITEDSNVAITTDQSFSSDVISPSQSHSEIEPTYIFTGTLLEKVGNSPMGSNPAQQFKIKVSRSKLASDIKGNIQGEVVVSSSDPDIRLFEEPFIHEFYTIYNSEKDWYELIRLRTFIVD